MPREGAADTPCTAHRVSPDRGPGGRSERRPRQGGQAVSMSTPAQGAPRLPGRASPRAAAAAWALTVLALGATASSAMAAETADSVLVRVDPAAPAGARAAVARALDADVGAPLVGGWRVYDLAEPISLSTRPRAARRRAGRRRRAARPAPATRWTSRTTRSTGRSGRCRASARRRAGTRRRAARPSWWRSSTPASTSATPTWRGACGPTPTRSPPTASTTTSTASWTTSPAGTSPTRTRRSTAPPTATSHGTHVAGTIAARRDNALGRRRRGRQRAHHAAEVPEAGRRLHLRRHGRDRLRHRQGREGHQRLVGRQRLLAAALRRDPARRRRRASSSSRPPATLGRQRRGPRPGPPTARPRRSSAWPRRPRPTAWPRSPTSGPRTVDLGAPGRHHPQHVPAAATATSRAPRWPRRT